MSRALQIVCVIAVAVCGSAATTTQAAITVTGVVTPADPATWPNWYYVFIGWSEAGSVTVDDDSDLLSKWETVLGADAGASGTGTVSGDGSTWTNSGDLYIGLRGDGVLNIVDDGLVQVGRGIFVAIEAGSSGVINFDNGTLTTGGLLTAPSNLSGVGAINTKGMVSDVDLVFDANNGLMQTFKLDGPGQDITVNLGIDGSARLGAGYAGNGSMHISDGLAVQSTSGLLGFQPGSTGVATVSGAGSAWSISGDLHVGRDGHGTLEITNGAAVSNVRGYIGDRSGSTGIVTVSGADSTWTNSGDWFHVGFDGDGTLEIRDGGTVSSWITHIGANTGSKGSVTVSGAESIWTTVYSLTVGYDGQGALNVYDGGLVSVDGALTIDRHADGNSSVRMATGGMLALPGDADDSLAQFLGLVSGTDDIRYWEDSVSDWADITGATPGEDYTLNYLTEGDLAGYTVLTVTAIPEPATLTLLALGGLASLFRLRV